MTDPSTTGTALGASSLTVRYGRHTILDELSLRAPQGGVYGLLGRNGAGKSTLVRCLLGQERPSGGEASLLGEDPWIDRPGLMARVGVVPESPQVPPSATADLLLDFGGRLHPTWRREEAVARLARFGVPRDRPFRRLSKGQQKQVELALALAQGPELLVLDDPSLGLDSVARRVLYEELLDHLADEGVTVFLTSHDLDALERLVDTVGILHRGRLVVEEPLESLKGRFRKIALPEGQSPDPEADSVVVRHGAWGREAVLAYSTNQPTPAPEARGEAMSLEEIFEALVGADEAGGAT